MGDFIPTLKKFFYLNLFITFVNQTTKHYQNEKHYHTINRGFQPIGHYSIH